MKLILTLLFALTFSFSSSFSQAVKRITFNVDMNPIGIKSKDTLLNVGIRGNIEPLMWVKGIKMKDTDQDGIYTAVVDFDISEEKDLIFKYVLNEVEWEGEEVRPLKLNSSTTGVLNHTFRYVVRPDNPFKKFMGEWTLKDDMWEQGNGEQPNEIIKLPDHYTLSKEVNTSNSLLSIIDATSSRGHIMWVYNENKKEVTWVSSFFPNRSGVGKGSVNDKGDLEVKVFFEGEPENTYRKYSYTWVNDNEYVLKSMQYNDKDEPTGSFYGGTFVRINKKGRIPGKI